MTDCTEKMVTPSPKVMREIVITTQHGDKFSISDTEECSPASLSIAEFKRGGVMSFTVEGVEYLVPASAVDSIKVEIISESE